MDATVQRFGCLHKSIHGDGNDILGRVVLTCEQMLHDRGCRTVARAADPLAAIEAGTDPVLRGRGDGVDVDLYVHTDDKVGVKWVRNILEAREDPRVSLVVVSIDGATPFTRKECEGKPIQFLLARDMCVNVTRHHLVPWHERIDHPPPGVDRDALPKILETDPVVQYYNWPVGTVVRVTRRFGGHEPTPYFRLVSPASS